ASLHSCPPSFTSFILLLPFSSPLLSTLSSLFVPSPSPIPPCILPQRLPPIRQVSWSDSDPSLCKPASISPWDISPPREVPPSSSLPLPSSLQTSASTTSLDPFTSHHHRTPHFHTPSSFPAPPSPPFCSPPSIRSNHFQSSQEHEGSHHGNCTESHMRSHYHTAQHAHSQGPMPPETRQMHSSPASHAPFDKDMHTPTSQYTLDPSSSSWPSSFPPSFPSHPHLLSPTMQQRSRGNSPPPFPPPERTEAAVAADTVARITGSADRPLNERMPCGASSQVDWLAIGQQGGGKMADWLVEGERRGGAKAETGEGGMESGEGKEGRAEGGNEKRTRERRALDVVYGEGGLGREEELVVGDCKKARLDGDLEGDGRRGETRERGCVVNTSQSPLSLFLSLGLGHAESEAKNALTTHEAHMNVPPVPAITADAAAAAHTPAGAVAVVPTPDLSASVDASGSAGEGRAGTGAGHRDASGTGNLPGKDSPVGKLSNDGSSGGRKPSDESLPAGGKPCIVGSPGDNQRSESSSVKHGQQEEEHQHPQEQQHHQQQQQHKQQHQQEEDDQQSLKRMRVKVFREGCLIARTVYLGLFSDFPSLHAHIAAMFGPALKAGREARARAHGTEAKGSGGGAAGAVAATGTAAGTGGAGAASESEDGGDVLAGWRLVYEDSDGDTLLVGDGTWT
ncbi:unnamed protein product, partial [Closterium sp. NIES-53]